ncbi:MAG: metallophosphoesterase family protein [Bacteroidia bacterium]|nr:metallophosphoesterase family protein [Bacteroidia bacterium]HQV00322.1 metallophosphoesterase family protein [Bacteroidia bacterium]
MIFGFLSDAHSHTESFFKGYRYLQTLCDKIFYLGDFVGYFPVSNQVIDAIRTDGIVSVIGNHDAMLLGYLPINPERDKIYQLAKTRNAISKINYDYLNSLPTSIEINSGNEKLLLMHGSPFDHLNGYIYPNSDLNPFTALAPDVFFMGHTHRPFYSKEQNKLIVNVGSVGFSRIAGNIINVVLYDTVSHAVTIKFIEVNVYQILTRYKNHLHPTLQNILRRDL